MEVKVTKEKTSFFPAPGRIFFALAGALAIFFASSAAAQDNAVYKDFSNLTRHLKSLVAEHPDISGLKSIGKTTEGKDIWLLTLGNKTGTDQNVRPALLISANLEANQLIGSALAIQISENLLNRYSDNPDVQKLLNEYVVYVLPRVNPDGSDAFLKMPQQLIRTNKTPYDGDNDGRMDEDGPEDLNSDGYITLMRVLDPEGIYCLDPENENLLKVADPSKGESGLYRVFWEGIDTDGDGFFNEDAVGGTDINRNFAHDYPYHQPDAGIHMVCEKETRAVMDWIIQQRNIAIMLTFSESDNLIHPPDSRGRLSSDREVSLFKFANASIAPASKTGMVRDRSSFGGGMMGGYYGRSPQGEQQQSSGRQGRKAATTYNNDDLAFYNKVSEEYKNLTGFTKSPSVRVPKGAFSEYGYFQYGILSLTTPGWSFPAKKDTAAVNSTPRRGARPAQGPGGGAQAGAAGSFDHELYSYLTDNGITGFVPWQKFQHPELGELEIGGFVPMSVYNPVSDAVQELGQKHTDFVVYLGSLFPKVNITVSDVQNHGDGLYRIRAEVSNEGFLPTSLQHGVASRSVKPTMVRLEIEPERIISGNNKTNFIQKLDGSGTVEKFEWLITGKKGDQIDIRVVSQKGGSKSEKIKLQ